MACEYTPDGKLPFQGGRIPRGVILPCGLPGRIVHAAGMKPAERCLAPTQAGGKCSWLAEKCPHHQPRTQALPRPPRRPPPAGQRSETEASTDTPQPLAAAIAARDMRETAWEWVRWLSAKSDGGSQAAAMLRLVAGMPPEGAATDDALREIELRALVSHGVPPRSPGEWALAERLFSAAGLAEMQRWVSLLEANPADHLQPFRRGDAAAVEVDVPFGVEGEDGR